MAWRKINDTKLTAIADAIRGKTGKSDALTLDQMPTEIAGIETGPSVSGEIAITANGTYDVTKYASANVNVQSAPVLVWQNASPSSSFQQESISFGDSYDGYLIEAYNFMLESAREPYITFIPADGVTYFISSFRDGDFEAKRNTTATPTGITFKVGTYAGSTCIPNRIWGIKGTL